MRQLLVILLLLVTGCSAQILPSENQNVPNYYSDLSHTPNDMPNPIIRLNW